MDKNEIKKLLPHREPMLLIDEVELVMVQNENVPAQGNAYKKALEKDGEEIHEEAVATYTVRGDEWFLQGHFPGNPVVPGVILCEMMGQSACVLVKQAGDYTPYFTGMDQIRFKNKVLPGDVITFRSKVDRAKGPFYFIKSAGYVNDKLCVSGELSFAVVKE